MLWEVETWAPRSFWWLDPCIWLSGRFIWDAAERAGSASVIFLPSSHTDPGSDFPAYRSSFSPLLYELGNSTLIYDVVILPNAWTPAFLYFLYFACVLAIFLSNRTMLRLARCFFLFPEMLCIAIELEQLRLSLQREAVASESIAAPSQWSQTPIYFYHSRYVSVVEEGLRESFFSPFFFGVLVDLRGIFE